MARCGTEWKLIFTRESVWPSSSRYRKFFVKKQQRCVISTKIIARIRDNTVSKIFFFRNTRTLHIFNIPNIIYVKIRPRVPLSLGVKSKRNVPKKKLKTGYGVRVKKERLVVGKQIACRDVESVSQDNGDEIPGREERPAFFSRLRIDRSSLQLEISRWSLWSERTLHTRDNTPCVRVNEKLSSKKTRSTAPLYRDGASNCAVDSLATASCFAYTRFSTPVEGDLAGRLNFFPPSATSRFSAFFQVLFRLLRSRVTVVRCSVSFFQRVGHPWPEIVFPRVVVVRWLKCLE